MKVFEHIRLFDFYTFSLLPLLIAASPLVVEQAIGVGLPLKN
jgi:hypothetical protein